MVTPTVPPEFSKLGALWANLMALHTQVDTVVGRVLQRHFGIGLSEFLVLSACAAAPDGEMRMQDLTEAVYLNQSSVSRMVTRLECDGLTERRTCEYDRRGVYTGITDKGRAVFRRAVPTYEAALKGALDRCARDPHLAPLVEKLNAPRG